MDKSWISPQMKSFLTFQTGDRGKNIFGVMKKWKKSVLLSIFIVLYICLELVNLAGLELAVARPNLSSNKSTLNRRSPLEGCLMRTALSVDAVSEAAYNIGFVKGGASCPCLRPSTMLHRFPSLGLKSRIDARMRA